MLHAKVGELTLENDFLSGAPGQSGFAERKAMIDRSHDLPITQRAKVLNTLGTYDVLPVEGSVGLVTGGGRPAPKPRCSGSVSPCQEVPHPRRQVLRSRLQAVGIREQPASLFA